MSKIYKRATEIYRQEKLDWYKRMGATGWDNATLKDVAHLEMDEPKLTAYALAKAMEEALRDSGGKP